MSHPHKLSLRSAIFININIMLGSGIFINTTVLAKQAGFLGAFSYTLVGILMLPLIIAIKNLLSIYPSGGFYTFAMKEIHPFAGFVSVWSYVIGKLASAVIVTHTAVLLLQQIFPWLATINPLLLDAGIITTFISLNMLDIKTSSTIQAYFLGFKIIPILFGIFAGFYLFTPTSITASSLMLENIPLTLPIVLFAIAGFEAACSLSSRIENAEKNGPRAIMISYAAVITTITLFQLAISGALGSALSSFIDYREVFPALVTQLFDSETSHINLAHLFHLAIAASALGGAYGMIFSNIWNVHTLAEHNHLIASSWFRKMNRYDIPWLCVLLEGVICLAYIYISGGSQLPLQQMSALGSAIAYSISALAAILAVRSKKLIIAPWITWLALANSSLMIGAAIYSLIVKGADLLGVFIGLLSIGSLIFFSRNR